MHIRHRYSGVEDCRQHTTRTNDYGRRVYRVDSTRRKFPSSTSFATHRRVEKPRGCPKLKNGNRRWFEIDFFYTFIGVLNKTKEKPSRVLWIRIIIIIIVR